MALDEEQSRNYRLPSVWCRVVCRKEGVGRSRGVSMVEWRQSKTILELLLAHMGLFE